MPIKMYPPQLVLNPRRSVGHTQAKAPIIPLDRPGRLRVGHVIALLGISHSTLYCGMRSGRYPKPDGKDYTIPYWNTATILRFLTDKAPSIGGNTCAP